MRPRIRKILRLTLTAKEKNGATANAAWLFFNASVQGQAANVSCIVQRKA